ncbi:MAG: AAA family ATPase [Desulfovibrionaceae bacterium]|nr:AAA family ATPase [Desulfovibrionaceae bacterium]
MFELLRIRNLALIEDVEIEFAPGLNVLTGETGAGKSFIMRAVDFLTGERMDRELVRPGAEKAAVEALFVTSEGEVILRRELSADTGRSRILVNDRLSSQEAVRGLKPSLVIHTSQFSQQQLLSPAFQAAVLDRFLADKDLVRKKNTALERLRALLSEKRALERKSGDLAGKREFLEFQLGEIGRLDPRPGEEEELLEAKRVLQDGERAAEGLKRALEALGRESGLARGLEDLAAELQGLARTGPEFSADLEAVEAFRDRMGDLETRLRKGPGRTGAGPDLSLDRIEARLFELSRLKRKLGRTLDGVLELKAEIERDLSFLDSCALDMKRLAAQELEASKRLAEALDALAGARQAAAKDLCAEIEAELVDLGFPDQARVRFEFEDLELYPGLSEKKGRLMWLPNPGQPARPLDRIASGGELSRFLLALVTLMGRGQDGREPGLPTLIFDEVDAGIGGLVLGKVGEKLKDLAERQQVVLITHWPQLARLAGRHFSVSKEVTAGVTRTGCRRLAEHEIFDELARMAGGGGAGQALAGSLFKS